MDFSHGLRLAKRYAAVIVVISLLGGAFAYAASFLVAPSFSSATRVLVRARDTRFLTSTGQDLSSSPGAMDFMQARSINQTLSGIATSRPVAETVVRELGLDERRPGDDSSLKRWVQTAAAYLQYGYYAEPNSLDTAVVNVQKRIEAI